MLSSPPRDESPIDPSVELISVERRAQAYDYTRDARRKGANADVDGAKGEPDSEKGADDDRSRGSSYGRVSQQDGARSGQRVSRRSTVELSVLQIMWKMLIGSKVNILLIFMPFGILAQVLKWSSAAIFFLNFLTLIPLAAMLGDFTEAVADHVGDTLGGLLNATFGNAVEMVIGVEALLHNEIRVVQASMLGSVLSNLLLVMGCCFLFGGLKTKEQSFNNTAATANLSLLFLATMAIVIPTPVGQSYDLSPEKELWISRSAALFLLAMYVQLVIFQLVTHRHLFDDNDEAEEGDAGDDDDGDEPELGLVPGIVGLCVVTLIVSLFSSFLVGSIDSLADNYGISKVFIGVILLPIVGNATEHATAVQVALKNRMELAMGVCVGSATQVSLFVIPFLVISGWIMNKPMTLNFAPIEIVLFIMAVLTTTPVLITGRSHWLHGSLLLTVYLFVSFAMWYEQGTVGPEEGNVEL